MANIVLINPRFEISFWGFEHAMALFGKRAALPVAALPLLAALTPDGHHVTLIDENVEPVDFDLCASADIVGVTGMIVQRQRMHEIVTELKRRGAYTVVGGPWVSVNEHYFDGLADTIFVGEAEDTWPQFLADWQVGKAQSRYEQLEPTDMSRVPTPKLGLLKMNRYAFGGIQFSRGCPFTCEFCDIIVIFGRRPRLKTSRQIIAELNDLRRMKMSYIFIVDDNLIGNKKAIKEVLRSVIDWQHANGFPITFVTEASIDLADDDELMHLMVEANIGAVFVGIESPNLESLKETKKLQNLRRGGTMLEKVRRIQAAGMEVWAGMILGFDNDDSTVFEAHRSFLDEARISMAMVGMLSAIPRTPLYKRLASAGRLDVADEIKLGTNVVPLNMSRETLSRGYVNLVSDLYKVDSYFDRVDNLYIDGKIEVDRAWKRYSRDHFWQRIAHDGVYALEAFGLIARLLVHARDPSLRRAYWRHFWRFCRTWPSVTTLRVYAIKCAIHFHMHKLVQTLSTSERARVNTF